MELNHQPTLLGLAKQAQQSAKETADYQRASSLVKVGAIDKPPASQKPLLRFFIGKILSSIAEYLPTCQINARLIHACKNIAPWDRSKHCLFNLNILHSFVKDMTIQPPSTLLGLNQKSISLYSLQPLLDAYVFDVFFHRTNDQNKPFMVITAPFTTDFQKQFAKVMMAIIEIYPV